MPVQEHTIDIEFDGEKYVARLEPSPPGLETPYSSQESFPVFKAVMNWLKVLEPDGNRGPNDDGRFIIFRIHENAFRDDDDADVGWGTLPWATRWSYRQLIVDEAGVERHHRVRYGCAVVLQLLKEAGGSATRVDLVRGKTKDGDTIWNHLVGGQDETDLLGPLAQSGVIAWDKEDKVTLLDTKGNPLQF